MCIRDRIGDARMSASPASARQPAAEGDAAAQPPRRAVLGGRGLGRGVMNFRGASVLVLRAVLSTGRKNNTVAGPSGQS
eukprot:10232896-Alexandrium_andersonii.AAC.1